MIYDYPIFEHWLVSFKPVGSSFPDVYAYIYTAYPGRLLDLKAKHLFETYLSNYMYIYMCIHISYLYEDIYPVVGVVWAHWIPFSIYCIPQQIGG